jgi:hypothetical protein
MSSSIGPKVATSGLVLSLDPSDQNSVANAYGGDRVYDIVISGITYTVHMFTNSGNSTFVPNRNMNVEVLVVGGGGGGGMDMGGGGGGGGVIYNSSFAVTANTPVSLTVGAGGYGAPRAGGGYRTDGVGPQPQFHQFTVSATSGSNSTFGSITAGGGGYGGSSYFDYTPNNGYGANGANGGSGGGASGYSNTGTGRNGTSTGGFAGGGSGGQYYAGGGGGAGGVGTGGTSIPNGGPGVLNSILGTSYYWGGGGGGGSYSLTLGGNGGIGGGGGGASAHGSQALPTGGAGLNNGQPSKGGGGGWNNSAGGNGGRNTGGGGGGGGHYSANNNGGEGGSGIVVVRYPRQTASAPIGNLINLVSPSYSTLTNGPVYSTSNYGIVTFDGTDDYANFTAPSLGTTTTVEIWAKLKNLSPGGDGTMIFGWNAYNAWIKDNSIGYNTFGGDRYGMASSVVTSLGIANTWKHFVFEMRSDVAYTNNKIYVNGVSQTLTQIAGSENSGNRVFNSGNGRISGTLGISGYSTSMDIGGFFVYNRALTQNEITHNFNSKRARYGI